MARQKEGMSEEEAEKVTESEIEDFIVEEADAVKKQTMEDIERLAKHAGMTPFEYVRIRIDETRYGEQSKAIKKTQAIH